MANNVKMAESDDDVSLSGGESIAVFTNNDEIEQEQKKVKKKKTGKSGGFQSLGLIKEIMRAITRMGYRVPTPIQRKILPIALSGRDVVAMARTGSGKTAAFVIPLLQSLQGHSTTVGVRAIILSPTRELAMQTLKFTKDLGKFLDLRACLLVGGDNMDDQFEALSNNPDIIIATPGRLMHHIREAGLNLRLVQYCVFDEADRLFEMGFAAQLKEIISTMPENRQTLLISATLPANLVEFARAGLNNPELIRLDTELRISDTLKVTFFTMRAEEKIAAFTYIVRNMISEDQQTIVFTATRHHVEFLFLILQTLNIPTSIVYGSMDQSARNVNLARFRNKKTRYMLVTDVAARGIDIPLLNNVINFDTPFSPKLFVHRVGRAGRAGHSGIAYSLVSPEELPALVDLHLFLGSRLQNVYVPTQGEPEVYNMQDCSGIYYGNLPESIVSTELEFIRDMISRSEDLKMLENSMKNAHKLYQRTRPTPSPSSVQRAKSLDRSHVHPLLVNHITEADSQLQEYLNKLREFRPNQTILETTPKTTPNSLNPSKAVNEAPNSVQTMKLKRILDDTRVSQHRKKIEQQKTQIEQEQLKSAECFEEETDVTNTQMSKNDGLVLNGISKEPQISATTETSLNKPTQHPKVKLSKSARKQLKKGHAIDLPLKATKRIKPIRDEENFIHYTKEEIEKDKALKIREDLNNKSESQRLEEAIIDLMPDESDKINSQRRALMWDKKKKKFVKTSYAELENRSKQSKVKIRNESGKVVHVNKDDRGDIYQKWKDRTKKAIARPGEQEKSTNSYNIVSRDLRTGAKRKIDTLQSKIKERIEEEPMAKRQKGKKVKNELRSASEIIREKKNRMMHDKSMKDKRRKQKDNTMRDRLAMKIDRRNPRTKSKLIIRT